MLFLRNRTLSFSDPSDKSEVGERRSVETTTTTPSTSAAAATADAGTAAAPPRSRRPFARVASWVAEVPAETSATKAAGAVKPPFSTAAANDNNPPSPLPLPSLPVWQRLLFKALVRTRAAGTNDKVLIMRTLTQEVAEEASPHRHEVNGDYLAKRFREARCSTPGRNAGLRALAAVGLSGSYWRSYARVVDRLLPGNYRFLDARARFFDATVREATSREAAAAAASRLGGGRGGGGGRASQVVALAAGYDSRLTRFLADPDGAEPPKEAPSSSPPPFDNKNLPLLRAFEVDLPEVVEGKRRLLEELLPDERRWPRPQLVAADLSDAAAARDTLLRAPGFDRRARTVFTAEGLFMYLPREKTLDLLREMGKVAAKGSLFAFDFLDAGACGVSSHDDIEAGRVPAPAGRGVFATLGHLVAGLGEPYLDAFPSDAEAQRALAESTGWRVREVLDPSSIERRFFPPSESGEKKKKRASKVPVVSRTNGFACWEKA